ncbi:hypothetical protein QR680_007939 [Steinernema hermaphroditum]|uniref:Uncharacterized protein n=1 Tax=Steinernema hermaphroditum TaxID=289476 RepID=A0AA39IG60_9BILA|nr:hypothetical protein QR680_007939 [Steinernema hermaphroditum]
MVGLVDSEDRRQGQWRNVRRERVHEEFDEYNGRNDIAILESDKSLLKRGVANVTSHGNCMYGPRGGVQPTFLRFVTLPLHDIKKCEHRRSRGWHVGDDQLCTGILEQQSETVTDIRGF